MLILVMKRKKKKAPMQYFAMQLGERKSFLICWIQSFLICWIYLKAASCPFSFAFAQGTERKVCFEKRIQYKTSPWIHCHFSPLPLCSAGFVVAVSLERLCSHLLSRVQLSILLPSFPGLKIFFWIPISILLHLLNIAISIISKLTLVLRPPNKKPYGKVDVSWRDHFVHF